MCEKAILENSGILDSAPESYKNQQMCCKAVDTHPSKIKFHLKCCKTQEMYEKVVNKCLFVSSSIPDWYKPQKMCDTVLSEDLFLTVYSPDKYKTQRMRDEAVDDFLAASTFIPRWFATSKMINNRFTALYADKNMLYFNEYCGNAILSSNETGILNIDLNDINFDDTNYNDHDPETIIHIRLLAWLIKFQI